MALENRRICPIDTHYGFLRLISSPENIAGSNPAGLSAPKATRSRIFRYASTVRRIAVTRPARQSDLTSANGMGRLHPRGDKQSSRVLEIIAYKSADPSVRPSDLHF